jgi:prepilin-type N-terminal cleavage/methylation domain-containing protein
MNFNQQNKTGFTQAPSGAGFTLIELLVAISIIGLLATLSFAAYDSARDKAKVSKAQEEISQIATAIEMLAIDTNEWPGHQLADIMCRDLPGGCPSGNELCGDGCANGLSSEAAGLTQNDSSNPYTGWAGPYIYSIPLDPWDNEYFFDTDYNHSTQGWVVVVGSYGPDGIGNNQYNSDDIINIIK